ncbi:MAG: Rrf2 family transcriptional regulator [Bacteroidia bacterium]|nr:Rrf2 family transcriptional regulator [Bacteroidia bacterium]
MLSKKAQYSIKALVYLAKNHKRSPLLISEIAESEGLPQKFLESALLDLKRMGIVCSKKGKGGGYYLIKNPDNITFAEIIRNFDGAIALFPCATFNYYEKCEHCKDENTCGLRSIVKDIRDATVKILKTNTLADVIKREKKLSLKK